VAGPFRIEGKPYTIPAAQAFVATGEEPAKSRYGAAIVVIGIVAVAAAGLIIYREKRALS
jgi:hypothetical protein